jgi:hypothetical protein
MKLTVITTFIAFTSQFLFSQQDKAIEFQNKKMDVSFISTETFNSFSTEEISMLKDNYILFENEIENIDLSEYFSPSSFKNNSPNPIVGPNKSNNDANELKIWTALHQDVIIITRSDFNDLSDDNKQMYLDNHYLILIGETLTLLDTQLYPY